MKFKVISVLLACVLLSSCAVDENQQINNNEQQQENNNTSGGDSTGGTSEGGTGGNTGSQGTAKLSDWPTEQQKFVLTYLNGKLPYYSKFNTFLTSEYENKPVYNPCVKNTSPGYNYEYEYKTLLLNSGWRENGSFEDEDGDLTYYFKLGNLSCQYCKYKDNDGVYWFDVYAFNDYLDDGALTSSVCSLNPTNLGLTKSYTSFTKTINGYKITATDMSKQNEIMQLKKSTGKLVIEGPSKGIAFITSRNADALFVRYGANKNSLKYCFNNGGTFTFDETANYIEVQTEGKAVLELETIDILN